jgi:hypothetical protein
VRGFDRVGWLNGAGLTVFVGDFFEYIMKFWDRMENGFKLVGLGLLRFLVYFGYVSAYKGFEFFV